MKLIDILGLIPESKGVRIYNGDRQTWVSGRCSTLLKSLNDGLLNMDCIEVSADDDELRLWIQGR